MGFYDITGCVGAQQNTLRSPLALALAVVKSKPDTISLYEYVHGLRQHVQIGRQEKIISQRDRHVDGASYWREMYDRAETARAGLRAKIHELERRNDSLKSNPEKPEKAATRSCSHRKRKRGKEDFADRALENPIKQAKALPHVDQIMPMNSAIEPELKCSSSHGSLMLLSYQLHRVLPQRIFDASNLSMILIQLASAVSHVVCATCERCQDQNSIVSVADTSSACNPQSDLTSTTQDLKRETSSTFRVLECTVQSIFKGFDKMTKDVVGKRGQGLIVYNIVKLFTNVISLMYTTSLSLAKQSVGIDEAFPSIRTRKVKGHHEKTGTTGSGTQSASLDIRTYLSHLLLVMLAELQPKQAAHCEIYEGFLYILLNRAGQLLHGFIFDELKGRDECWDIRALRSRAVNECKNKEVERRARQEEAGYLIVILERALGLFSQGFLGRHPFQSREGPRKGTTGVHMSKDLLSANARMRLQNTLLRGMFGDDEKIFQDSLQRPVIPRADSKMPTTPGQSANAEEWFKGQIWRLLGWEILADTLNLDTNHLGPDTVKA